jgi:uncharacterized Zn-binding protein involved in type VI secretion
MASVTVNAPKTPVTKGSSGIAANTVPNVCKMPGPPAPFVPTPLPNIGQSGKTPQGYSSTVEIEGQPVAIQGSSFGSTGDIASQGTGGGIVSNNVEGPTKFIGPGSFTVKIEGKNVQLLADPMMNNCGPSGSPPNAATMAGLNQASGAASSPEEVKKCKEQRGKIQGKYKKLGKELRKYVPAKDAIGGFPMRGGKLTKPCGHFIEIKDLQRGLKNDLTKFNRDCAGSGVALNRNVDRMASRPIVRPPGC